MEPWQIALIVIGCLVVVGTILCVYFFVIEPSTGINNRPGNDVYQTTNLQFFDTINIDEAFENLSGPTVDPVNEANYVMRFGATSKTTTVLPISLLNANIRYKASKMVYLENADRWLHIVSTEFLDDTGQVAEYRVYASFDDISYLMHRSTTPVTIGATHAIDRSTTESFVVVGILGETGLVYTLRYDDTVWRLVKEPIELSYTAPTFGRSVLMTLIRGSQLNLYVGRGPVAGGNTGGVTKFVWDGDNGRWNESTSLVTFDSISNAPEFGQALAGSGYNVFVASLDKIYYFYKDQDMIYYLTSGRAIQSIDFSLGMIAVATRASTAAYAELYTIESSKFKHLATISYNYFTGNRLRVRLPTDKIGALLFDDGYQLFVYPINLYNTGLSKTTFAATIGRSVVLSARQLEDPQIYMNQNAVNISVMDVTSTQTKQLTTVYDQSVL